jgi:hypothetical protein
MRQPGKWSPPTPNDRPLCIRRGRGRPRSLVSPHRNRPNIFVIQYESATVEGTEDLAPLSGSAVAGHPEPSPGSREAVDGLDRALAYPGKPIRRFRSERAPRCLPSFL